MKKLIILAVILSAFACTPPKRNTNVTLIVQDLSVAGNKFHFKKCSEAYSIKCEWTKPVLEVCKYSLNCPGCGPNQLCMGNLGFMGIDYLDVYIQTYDEASKTYKTILTAKTIGKDKVFEIKENINTKNMRYLFTSNSPIKEDFDVELAYLK